MAIKIEHLEQLKWLLKLSALLKKAGLSEDLVISRRRSGSQLTVDESEAIEKVLKEAGVVITEKPSN